MQSVIQPADIDPPIYIDTQERLKDYCQQWSQAEILALDTEFIRTDTFYPKGALVQVCDGKTSCLIDPLVIPDLSPFALILSNPCIVKVLHSCSEDLEVFDRLFNTLPNPIIDTQIAAALDGYGFSLGYQNLIETLLNVHVPKGETRSNWLQRPLSDSQIHYANLDVVYLPQAYHLLRDSLSHKGRWEWLQEDCKKMLDAFTDTGHIENYYQKVKSGWKLSSSDLHILKELTQWREKQARERDMPRGRILKDHSCYEIAIKKPRSSNELSRIKDVYHGTIKRYGQIIMDLVETALSVDAAHCPDRLPKPLPPESGKRLKSLKHHVSARAEQLQLAKEMLVRKKDYEALLRSGDGGRNYQLPSSLQGWRETVIGNELLDILRQA